MLATTAPSHAQTEQPLSQGALHQQEYAISNGGAVWRVEANGSLNGYDPSGEATSGFYHYAYGPSLLQVSPDSSTIYAGGQQFLTRGAAGKTSIEAYRLSPQGRFRLTDTFARESSGDLPYALAFGGSGRFVYVLTLRGMAAKHPFSALSSYRVGKGGRVMRLPVPEQRIAAAGPDQLNMISDPSGHFLYVTQPQSRTVDVYRIMANGTIKALFPSAVSLPQAPSRLLCPSSGPFLYVVSRNDNSLTQLRRGENGSLQMAHFFRFGDVNPKRAADPILMIAPNGRFLYVGDDTLPVTHQYVIYPDGIIKPLSPPTAAFSPDSIAVDLTSQFAYLTDAGVTNQELIHPYRIGPSGTLVRITGNPTATAGNVLLKFSQPR